MIPQDPTSKGIRISFRLERTWSPGSATVSATCIFWCYPGPECCGVLGSVLYWIGPLSGCTANRKTPSTVNFEGLHHIYLKYIWSTGESRTNKSFRYSYVPFDFCVEFLNHKALRIIVLWKVTKWNWQYYPAYFLVTRNSWMRRAMTYGAPHKYPHWVLSLQDQAYWTGTPELVWRQPRRRS